MSNIITAYFKGRTGVAEAVYQNDYGIVMAFDSIDLPAHFDCYFSVPGSDTSTAAVGADNRVVIPNSVLGNPGNMSVHIPLHTGSSDSEVEYVAYFKVIGRARPEDDGTPTQMTAIEQALALLQNPITNIEQIVNEALAFTGDTFAEMKQELQDDFDNYTDTLEGDLATWKGGVESDIDDVEADFAVLQGQFDTAVAAVTTDTEVTDIRVGADGVTDTTAGASVRRQFTDLKSDLTNVANRMNHIVALVSTTPTYNMLDNKVISADGTVLNTTGTSSKVTDYIPVEAGNVVTFKYSRARWNNKNWAFYDTNKNVVSVYPKSASGITVEMNGVLVVPNRAKYFVVGYDVSNTQPLPDVRVVTKYAESINNVAESAAYQYTDAQLTEESITATNSSSKVIGTDCFILDISSADYKVSQASVSYGDVITIRNCSARYTSKMYAFYDVADSPIYSVSRVDDNAHDFKAIEVPFGAVKIAVSGYGTYATLSKVTKIATASSAWSGKKWACMGDSLTDADNARATKRYFDYIEDATGITVVNLGKSGTGYKKEHNSNLPFYQRVDTIPLDSDVITIFGSGNDCNQTLGDVTDTGTTTVCGCINNTIDGIRARIVGANIGIITPTPWEPYPPSTVGNKMDLYSEALVEICKRKGVPCLDLYHCSNMLPWEQSFREAFYTHDDGGGTHPDENGHKFFAPHIKAFLETLLM